MKQGSSLSPTLFGLYIDDMKSFILESIDLEIGCLLHDNRVAILLFADDVVLFSHSIEAYKD